MWKVFKVEIAYIGGVWDITGEVYIDDCTLAKT